jgi:hypothetical protein
MGAIVAVLHLYTHKSLPKKVNSCLCLISLLILFYSVNNFGHAQNYPGVLALIVCLSTSILIAFLFNSHLSELFSLKPLRFVGKISYSLYLVHWPLIIFYRDIKFGFSPIDLFKYPTLNPNEKFLIFLISMITAYLLKTLVEDKFRGYYINSSNFLKRRSLLFLISLFLTITLSVVCLVTNGMNFRTEPKLFAKIDENDLPIQCAFNYDFKFLDWDHPCGIGVNKKVPDVVLLGDSHMRHYTAGFDKLFKELGISGAMQIGGGSLPIPGGQSYVLGEKTAIFDGVFQYILKNKPRLVILSARWDVHLQDFIVDYPGDFPNRFLWGPYQSLTTESSQKAVEFGLTNMFSKLNAEKINVLVIGPLVFPGKVMHRCYLRPSYFASYEKRCTYLSKRMQLEYEKKALEILKNSSHSFPNIRILDLIPNICGENSCEIVDPKTQTLIYEDSYHLTQKGGIYIINKFVASEVIKNLNLH